MSSAGSDILVFDRAAVRQHRNRMATRLPLHDFLHAEVAERLRDRLEDVQRTFTSALLIGGSGYEDVVFAPRPERRKRGGAPDCSICGETDPCTQSSR